MTHSAKFRNKDLSSWLLMILSITLGAGFAFGVPTVFKTGTTIKKPGAMPGYVIVNLPDGNSYAIDVSGKFARTWTSPVVGSTLGYTRPLPTGNLLALLVQTGVNQAAEFTQGGTVVWQYIETGDRTFHHDITRMPNGNTLIVCSRQVTYSGISSKVLTDDCLLEVDKDGNTVFTWQTADHFAEFGFSDVAKTLIANNAGDWAHMNSAEVIPENNYHDPRFRKGNFIISYRYLNMLIIVDPTTGSIVWQNSNVTIGQHDATMIKGGLSGQGNILVFDNGMSNVINNPGPVSGRLNSRVLELNPLDGSIVKSYDESQSGHPIWWFYGPFVGSAQRLSNGNTFIDEGPDGRLFEVTSTGDIVWEWMNGIIGQGTQGPTNLIYRAEKVPLEWLLPQ